MDKFGKWLDGQGIGGNLNAHTKWGSFNEYRMLVSDHDKACGCKTQFAFYVEIC